MKILIKNNVLEIINKSIIIIVMALLLLSCRSGKVFMKPPLNAPSNDATIKLAQAAAAISDSMLEMQKVEKIILPPNKDNILTIPSAYNLQTRASVDWSGPIREITLRVTQAAHFRLRVLGTEPSVPILVSINAKDMSLAEILRDIDYQAAKKASIHVYPKHQVVELRYAKLYS